MKESELGCQHGVRASYAITKETQAAMQLKMQSTATPTLTSCDVFQVQPVLVKKQPKFPSRERHMAIRRKKSMAPPGGNCEKCSDER